MIVKNTIPVVKNTTPQITQMYADKILTWYLQERTLQERIWLLICGFDLDLLHQFRDADASARNWGRFFPPFGCGDLDLSGF